MPEAILRFVQGYRVRPEPQHLALTFTAMSRFGIFRDMEQAGVHIGFVGGVLSTMDRETALKSLAKMFPLSPEDQPALIKAIAYSGHPEWKALLSGIAERMPSRAVLVDRYLSDKLPVLGAVPLDAGPQPLDALWGLYYATGSFEPILRIIAVVKWSADQNDVERLTIGSMSKWTLAQNASRDVDLLRLIKSALAFEPPGRTEEASGSDRGCRNGRNGKNPQRSVSGDRAIEDQRTGEHAQHAMVGAGGSNRVGARLCRRQPHSAMWPSVSPV